MTRPLVAMLLLAAASAPSAAEEAGIHRQGVYYPRTGGKIGLRRQF